ncbi:PREDICTED: cytochrome P450 2A5-like [Nanorana parkeri]|uniref:cytochrome P450 2A5-like n=1 Tax=Nanorana parkeri TaxID=125878 RepID=UPI000854A71F|nr:PREDICTED: cytochrome P450 2A5-like [Nanorana parkeri]
MDVLTLSLCSFLLFYFIITIWKIQKTRLRLPPGPTPLPFIGNLLQVSFALYRFYPKLAKQYGPIFTVWLGSKPVVVLCGYTVIKEALINYSHQFSARGHLAVSGRLAQGYGIVTTNGERWQQVRRFAVTALRNFGMGKRSMEERVQEESRHLIKAIDDIGGEAFNPLAVVGRAVNNVINLVVFGRRWDYEDETFLKFLSIVNNLFTFLRSRLGLAYTAFDSLMKHLPGPHQKVFADCEHVKSFIREEIESHRRTLDPESPRDFIDCFLIQANKEKDVRSSELCQENLQASVFELFLAGTETTANNVQFSLLVMIKHPDIQERIQEEIDAVIVMDRLPCVADRFQMPYTNAVIHELMRYIDIVPMGLARKVTEDTNFRGFILPKGTTVFPLLTSALADPEYWKAPYDFNPENFLDENGKFCPQEALIPFSTGKRICPGESLARMEIFLFLTALLQKFSFKPENPTDTFNLDVLRRTFRKQGLTYNLRAIPRTKKINGHTRQ